MFVCDKDFGLESYSLMQLISGFECLNFLGRMKGWIKASVRIVNCIMV